jgi:hypothetical protein
VLLKVAIGKAKSRYGSAKTFVVDFLHVKARLNRQAGQVRTNGTAFNSERVRRQGGEAHLAATARTNGADHRTVVQNTTHADRAVETGISKQLAGDERPCLLWREFLRKSGTRSQYARAQDGNTQQH